MSRIHDNRMKKFARAGIYFVTSQSLSKGRSTIDIVRAALKGGIKLVQLREKDLSDDETRELAMEIRTLTTNADALLIINDRPDIAMAVNADGVHLGQTDESVDTVRNMAPDLIIGASTHTVDEAINAENLGASYINIGPIFPTGTKEWNKDFLGIESISRISSNINIPFTVMGGIKAEHIPTLMKAGASAIALVTAISAADDPEEAARELIEIYRSENR